MGSSLNDSYDSESDDQLSPTAVTLSSSFSSNSSSKNGGKDVSGGASSTGSTSSSSSSSAAAAARAKKLAKAERKKRKQVKKACFACRKAHARCDDQRPCRRCVRMGHQATCIDIPRKKRVIKKGKDGIGYEEDDDEENEENENDNENSQSEQTASAATATVKRPRRTKRTRLPANNPFHSPDEGSDSCESGPDDCTNPHHHSHRHARAKASAAEGDGDDDYKPKRNQIQQRLRARRGLQQQHQHQQRRDRNVEDSEEEVLAATRPVVTDSSGSERDDAAAENFFFNKQSSRHHNRAKRAPGGGMYNASASSSSWQESLGDNLGYGSDGTTMHSIDLESDIIRGGSPDDEYGPYANDPTAREMMKELEELRSYNSGLQEMIRDVQEFNAYQRHKRSEWNNKLSSFERSKVMMPPGAAAPSMMTPNMGVGGQLPSSLPVSVQSTMLNPGAAVNSNQSGAIDNNLRLRISNKFQTTASPNPVSGMSMMPQPPSSSSSLSSSVQTMSTPTTLTTSMTHTNPMVPPPPPQGPARSAFTTRRDPTLMHGYVPSNSSAAGPSPSAGATDNFTFVQPAPRRPPA